jgi:hypothetical protein
MTRDEAEVLMKRYGCTDTTKPALCHYALCRWIDRYGRGEAPLEPMAEAYAELRRVEPPAAKQVALFAEKGADL